MYLILVALDGTLHAEIGVAWADTLARALNAEIEIVQVVTQPELNIGDLGDVQPSGELRFDLRVGDAQRYLDEICARLREERPDARPPLNQVLVGKPGAVLAQHARANAVDLIVMTSHVHSGLGRLLAGNVTGEVVRESSIPVLSIGPKAAERPVAMPRSVLVPMDKSDMAKRVLEPLEPLVRGASMRLVLFRDMPGPPGLLPVQGALIPMNLESAEAPRITGEDLDTLAAGLKARGIETEVVLGYGGRVQSIVETAQAQGVDLIAMSTHASEGLGHWLWRSVAEDVNAEATVPVLEFHPRG